MTVGGDRRPGIPIRQCANLLRRTADNPSEPTVEVVVNTLTIVPLPNLLRKAHAEEQLTTTLTTRGLLALCARLARGNDFQRAMATCVLNKAIEEDRKVISETFDHHVGLMGKAKSRG